MDETLAVANQQAAGSGYRRGWVVWIYCLVVVLLYWETIWSMVSIWQRSETYAHGYLIVPISLALVWAKRSALARQELRPVFWVQLLLIPGGLVWLMSFLVDVLVVQQLALVGLLIVGIWSLIGHSMAWTLAFPLGFLFLAVPMGEDLVPPMMEMTATSTVWLIELTGIPVYREGLYFNLPTGNWSVVEACSGVRYLIASFTLGLLYAHLTYRSPLRQLLFVLASIIVPIIANTLRAYMIVMLGHFSGMKLATGVDHLIYGWVFFGLVMLLLFWVGSFWREDDQPPVVATDKVAAQSRESGKFSPGLALLTATVLAGFWPVFSMVISQSSYGVETATISSPVAAGGWAREGQPSWDWQPRPAGADNELAVFYRAGTQPVALYIQQYLRQEQGRELVSGKIGQFVDEEQSWRITASGKTAIKLGDIQIDANRFGLTGNSAELLIWNWYRIGNHYTANPYIAKWYEAVAAITFTRQDSARIILATPVTTDSADSMLLEAFTKANLEAIEYSLDTTSGTTVQ